MILMSNDDCCSLLLSFLYCSLSYGRWWGCHVCTTAVCVRLTWHGTWDTSIAAHIFRFQHGTNRTNTRAISTLQSVTAKQLPENSSCLCALTVPEP